MDSTEFVDPYLDPDTGLLRNKVGARTKVALDEAEGDLSFARLIQLMERPPRATDDLAELRAIHRYLFQDVYEWAGEVRTVDIRKNVEGAEYFLPVSMIGRAAGYAADELRADNSLRGMDRDQFIDRLAYHYDQFNYVHPFREGNGRTQRVFWNRVARDAGWQLDWRGVQGTTNDEACRAASERRDFGPLRDMFDQIVTKAAPVTDRDDAWRAAERARLSFPTSATRVVQHRPEPPSGPPQARSTELPGRGFGGTARGGEGR
jgi:cell filamentation protein